MLIRHHRPQSSPTTRTNHVFDDKPEDPSIRNQFQAPVFDPHRSSGCHTGAMTTLRRRLRSLVRRVTTVEPVHDEQTGEGPVAPDVLRNLPPGGGGAGV
jgi:hypothetical protein